MERFTIISEVGKGSFGRVFKATEKETNSIVALKVIVKRGRSAKEINSLRQECEIQRSLRHPNIIQMLESFETNYKIIVVTEFAKCDLQALLLREGSIGELRAQKLTIDLVSALYYLHSHRILHRDLKPQNILLDIDENAKLCDFGLARNMTIGTYVLTSIKGTPLYMAPELMAEKPYDHQADLWSLGCIIYEVLAGKPPFCTTSIVRLLRLIQHDNVKWPKGLTENCISFLQGLLEKDPALRMTWTEILNHAFVKNRIAILDEDIQSPFTDPMTASESREKFKQTEKILYGNKVSYSPLNSTSIPEKHNVSINTNDVLQNDYETLETDTDESILLSNNKGLDYCDKPKSKIIIPIISEITKDKSLPDMMTEYCKINDICFVADNPNLIVNRYNDNFALVPLTNNSTCGSMNNSKLNRNQIISLKNKTKMKNNELEKRKLSQNLDNFSVRLGQSLEIDKNRRQRSESCGTDDLTPSLQETNTAPNDKIKSTKIIELSNAINSEWESSCDESQTYPTENEEWIAFLQKSMQEVLDGELDSLKQQNLVSIIMTPLRNSRASCKVIENVSQLLSIPLVLCGSSSLLQDIQKVYIEVKLVPNLVYASKLLCSRTSTKSSSPIQIPPVIDIHTIAELSSDKVRTLSSLYELACFLVHSADQFLSQFCDAIAILGADELLINFIATVSEDDIKIRLVNSVIALLCCTIRELPENAELVEKIIFNEKVNIVTLLRHNNSLIRSRMCMLLRLIGRFSCRALQSNWSCLIRETVEGLVYDSIDFVRNEAESVLEEFKHLSFYSQ